MQKQIVGTLWKYMKNVTLNILKPNIIPFWVQF